MDDGVSPPLALLWVVMESAALRRLLEDVQAKRRTVEQAVEDLSHLPFEDMGFAKVDHHRSIRCGFPEVVYCQGKQTDQVVAIIDRRLADGGNLLATRAAPEVARAVRARFRKARYNKIARTLTIRQQPAQPRAGFVAIVCAGTSDMPVAEEARETCEIMDQPTRHYYDVGVAGIHRLLAHCEELRQAVAVITCAGMEGALPSVVGGLVACPVIAVPTSVGYGAHLGGIAPLLTMLNSCAAGVSVVNIDNGFGAGYIAALIGQAVARAAGDQQAGAQQVERSQPSKPKRAIRKVARKKTAKKRTKISSPKKRTQ